MALSPGESQPIIAKLLGTSNVETTAHHTFLARDLVKLTAEGLRLVLLSAGVRAFLPQGDLHIAFCE